MLFLRIPSISFFNRRIPSFEISESFFRKNIEQRIACAVLLEQLTVMFRGVKVEGNIFSQYRTHEHFIMRVRKRISLNHLLSYRFIVIRVALSHRSITNSFTCRPRCLTSAGKSLALYKKADVDTRRYTDRPTRVDNYARNSPRNAESDSFRERVCDGFCRYVSGRDRMDRLQKDNRVVVDRGAGRVPRRFQ